ncbi:MAG: hypothetical protein SF097_22440 [Acidobacteriota bacterium]|nr:hypothetical protein [Acidobacteriota bacterium]
MLTEKVKKRDSNYSDSLQTSTSTVSTNDQKAGSFDKKPNNVLPLERPKGNTGKLRLPVVITEAHPEADQVPGAAAETTEIKSRMEAVLAQMKSRSTAFEENKASQSGQADERDAAGESAEVKSDSSAIESLGQEIERRKAAIIAIAREAEARSRDAADKLRLAEARLKEQTELRQQAEQRLAEFEEESKQWQNVAQSEELKRIESEIAKVEFEERIKQEAEARQIAEKARTEAEAACAQAEARAKNVEETYIAAEAKVRAAEEAARTAESLIYEADAIARQMEEKYKASEANLRREAELRVLAEQMLKELASVVPNLEINWDNLETAFSQVTTIAQSPAQIATSDAAQSELRSQIEAEQKARLTAEEARADAEAKAADLEKKLRKAEDRYKTAETGYKKVLRKQEEELRTLSEQITRSNDSTTSLTTAKTDDEIMFLDVAQANAGSGKIKLVFYGALITVLMSALVWLGAVAFRQL